MTPAARLSAAIQILDRILAGAPAEQALINWARASRFAGSGDRNAIRDLVFDALRCRRSFAALGGGETGRGLVLGALRASGTDPEALFTGEGHAPAPLGPEDAGRAPQGFEISDIPEWIGPQLQADLGADFAAVTAAMRHRAPVFLRVNLRRTTQAQALAALVEDGVEAVPHALSPTALEVTVGARKIASSRAYAEGRVELQDAASQAVIDALPLSDGMRVLDFCAGGGGKTLAMAGRARLALFAHDAAPARMRDLPTRAKRAGAKVTITEAPKAPFDLVLADVPCSGSGSWRRAPEGKWLLTPERLKSLVDVQAKILRDVATLVRPGGWIGYATCSMLNIENGAQIHDFLSENTKWTCDFQRSLTPLEGGDGFFVAVLKHSPKG